MSNFNINLFLDKMRKGASNLTEFEVNEFIRGVANKSIPDYQVSAFLMAAAIHKMPEREIAWLTEAMAKSGHIFKPKGRPGQIFIDKHSSGGIGDKMTILLSPIVASLGLTVLKASGRGLGFTGGTIDKLNSVGVKTNISFDEASKIAGLTNIAIFEANEDIAPADKILYTLRDVTSTVQSNALIASSIMSKKLAFESDALFIDVKYGSGALCKTFEAASILARTMNSIGSLARRRIVTHITSMQQPLGYSIGNAIEVLEAHNFLKGEQQAPDLKKLVTYFVADILQVTGQAASFDDGSKKVEKCISDGSALKAMESWFEAQGVDMDSFRKQTYFNPKHKLEVKAPKSGYFGIVNNEEMGHISNRLGAGRLQASDPVDYQAGIHVHKKINDIVQEGDLLYTFYSSNPIDNDLAKDILDNTILSENKQVLEELIIKCGD